MRNISWEWKVIRQKSNEYTYYSLSDTKSSFSSKSPNRSAEMKLLPSGSYWPNTRLAMSAGVSEFVSLFSKENKTEI